MEQSNKKSIDNMNSVSVPLVVEIGRTRMKVKDLLNIKPGSVIPFEKIVGEPMDMLVSERLMARGEVVVVNERYGIRISEVSRPDEKLGGRRKD